MAYLAFIVFTPAFTSLFIKEAASFYPMEHAADFVVL